MDDCSTDNTFELLNTFNDVRIRLFKNDKNIGLTKSLNILIQESNGEILARQDGDDVSFPKGIEKQIDYLSRKQIKLVHPELF